MTSKSIENFLGAIVKIKSLAPGRKSQNMPLNPENSLQSSNLIIY